MNNFQVPYIPLPFPNNIEYEIIKLKKEIKQLKERIKNLENENKDDYLEKDDGLYMI